MAVVDKVMTLDSTSWEDELETVLPKTEKTEKKEEPKTEAKTEGADNQPVPDDHPTKLGRKVKEMGERMDSFMSRFDRFLDGLEQNSNARHRAEPEPAEEDEDPEVLRVVQKVETRQQRREEASQRAQNEYVQRYIKAVRKGLGDDDVDEDLHEAVCDEVLETNFRSYKKISGDPEYDARVNYDLALAKILRKQRKEGAAKPNVKGGRDLPPTNVSSGTSGAEPPKKEVKLDPFAQKFVNSLRNSGEDVSWVEKSLGRKTDEE